MLMKKEVIEDNENLKKEIKDLKKQLEEEKNAYNRMYNMYVEKDNIINELEERYYSLDQNMGKSIIENDTREDFVKMEEIFIKAKRCDKE